MIVVYGDCGTGGRLDEVLARYPAVRPAGVHCFQWYAGELYERFDDDIGIYFLTDWLVHELGARGDQGPRPRPVPVAEGHVLRQPQRGSSSCASTPTPTREAKAREIAAWMGKPLEIHDLGIEPLEELLVPLMDASRRRRRRPMFDR